MTVQQVRIQKAQRAMNRFTGRYLRKVVPLVQDGEFGPVTKVRVRSCKWYLGYGETRDANTMAITDKFTRALKSPKGRFLGRQALAAGAARRLRQRSRSRSEGAKATATPGVTRYDGVPVARWMVPYLAWARRAGWQGRLVSGWRSPSYSDSLCRRMCGRPSCPGRCAGRASNHAGSAKPAGALDVTHYRRFGELMASCPLRPSLINRLGARDPVHFSVSGK